jgi:hypothetical protein
MQGPVAMSRSAWGIGSGAGRIHWEPSLIGVRPLGRRGSASGGPASALPPAAAAHGGGSSITGCCRTCAPGPPGGPYRAELRPIATLAGPSFDALAPCLHRHCNGRVEAAPAGRVSQTRWNSSQTPLEITPRIAAGPMPGGGGGIRTPGEREPTSDFKSGALNHSATPPQSGYTLVGARGMSSFLPRPISLVSAAPAPRSVRSTAG